MASSNRLAKVPLVFLLAFLSTSIALSQVGICTNSVVTKRGKAEGMNCVGGSNDGNPCTGPTALNGWTNDCPGGRCGQYVDFSETDDNFDNVAELCQFNLEDWPVGGPLVLSDGNSASPALQFSEASGPYYDAGTDAVYFSLAAVARWGMLPSYFGSVNSSGPRMAFSSDPAFTWNDDPDTGISNPIADALALTAGGVEGLRLTEATTVQLRLPSYGSGAITGTESYTLAVDSSGNVIEITGGGTSPKQGYWTAAALLPLEHTANAVAPLAKDEGTNVDMQVALYDDTAYECRGGTYFVASDASTSATVTFTSKFYAVTGSTSAVMWDFKHNARANSEGWDAALTTESAAACSPSAATQDLETFCTWTETMTNLGWSPGDQINFELCRNGPSGSDTLTGDAALIDFRIDTPRTGSQAPLDGYYQWSAGGFEMHGTNQAPLAAATGTNQNYNVRLFDDTTSECNWFRFSLPGDFDQTGTPVATAIWRAASITGNVKWAITHTARAHNENIDVAGTTDTSAAATVVGTTLYENVTSWNLTDTNWTANDMIYGKLCRDISDTLSGDAQLIYLTISVPRS